MVTHDEFLDSFLTRTLKSESYKVFSLAGDASNRRYYRVVMDHQSAVLMRWEPFDPNNYPFVSVQQHFEKNGVRVPHIIEMSPQEGLVLLEDLGDLTLERRFWESQNQEGSIDFYKMAIDELIKIHFRATRDRSPCTAFNIQFDTAKFLWEMNYAREHLIEGVLAFQLEEKNSQALQNCFTSISERLNNETKYISHRDYHSRNLMMKLDEMTVIDFQDARMGPVQYDLVSLLKDSYVDIHDQTASVLLDYYLDAAKSEGFAPVSRAQFDVIYELQSVQRCFKACGSFASFFNMRQDRRYLKYLSGTLRRVMKSLSHFPEYKILSDVLIDSGAMEKKYEAL
ncbi:MAG TPA: phosphotransferase [Pseudobdellovibrionaceae bacterium]|nr:phosphotransferase [Pseudobdellovibrionaceae bacterium]